MLQQTFLNEKYNCTHITLVAMLQRLGMDVTHLFNQAGLYFEYQKVNTNKIIIDPYYKSIKDNVKKHFNLNFETEEYSDMKTFILRLEDLLEAKCTVGVLVDVYSLEYSHLNDKKIHYLHSFEILDKKSDHYMVFDHFFSHSEEMHQDRLQKILQEFQNGLSSGQLVLFYLNKENQRQSIMSRKNYIDALKTNWRIMKGERCFLLQDTINYPGFLGLEAIEECGEHLLNLIKGEYDNKDFLVSHIYTSLKEVANSRYHVHTFLNKYDDEELSKLYLTSHQNWIVYANLLMKAFMFPKIDISERLQSRIQQLYEKEKLILENIEGRLS